MESKRIDIYARLKEIGVQIPELPRPVASYLPAVIHQNLIYASGQTGTVNQELVFRGKLGDELTIDQDKSSARLAVLNCLAELQYTLGDLNRLERIVRLNGYVASTSGFYDQPQVIEGASALLIEVFGERGWYARFVIGVAALPSNAPVEVELIVSILS